MAPNLKKKEIQSVFMAKYTCLKLDTSAVGGPPEPIFIKGTWFATRFDLAMTDGLQAWVCHATEEEVTERASNWDQNASDYVEFAGRYLGFQQPGSVYVVSDAENGCKRVSFTFEKEGMMKLEWRWKLQPSSNSKKTTAEMMEFLTDANIRLSEEIMWKTKAIDELKLEMEKCVEQSERLCREKIAFETEIYGKFVHVLNSKKAKLRDLRDERGVVPLQSFDEETDSE